MTISMIIIFWALKELVFVPNTLVATKQISPSIYISRHQGLEISRHCALGKHSPHATGG